MKNIYFFPLIASLFIGGCAAYQPVPRDYVGSTATIVDSGFLEDNSSGQLFVLSEIDGNRVDNSFQSTARASQGQKSALTIKIVERQVPAKRMKVTIRGSEVTGAPIQALFRSAKGNLLSVDGTIDFSPKPNGRYVVKGELNKDRSAVWIEDAETKQIVTERVSQK